MAETAVQLNEEVSGYIRVPYSYYKRHARRSKILLLSTIFTFSNSNGSKMCNLAYRRFEEKLDLSHGTVAREIKALKESGEITQDKSRRAGAAYSDAQRTKEQGFVKIELYLYHTLFNVRGEQEARYLTKAEIDVLCLIKTHCANERGEGMFCGSVRGIAGTLNLCNKTVQKAITTLLRAGLIYRSAENRGVNGHQRSVYTVNEKLLRRTEKNYKKANVPAKPLRRSLSEDEKVASARADRERYYSEIRNRALNRVTFFTDQLNQDDTYKRINAAWKATEPKIARAEVFNLPELEELRKDKRRLGAQRAQRMAELMISESDLTPQWHCKKCSDTGHLPSGKPCNCYPERGRRQ